MFKRCVQRLRSTGNVAKFHQHEPVPPRDHGIPLLSERSLVRHRRLDVAPSRTRPIGLVHERDKLDFFGSVRNVRKRLRLIRGRIGSCDTRRT